MSQKSYDGTPTVYLIPTPIGNMDDITLRSIKILQKIEVIFSEDTRVTSLLLNHLQISKKLISSHKFNESENKDRLMNYLEQGYDVGIVSDRGTPVISDPGFELTKYAIENGYNVVGLPGATALIPALIMSGITPLPFLFYGFLDHKEGKRKKQLQQIIELPYTLIFYEAPHRLKAMLQNMLDILGNRKISISREISKKYEEIYRGSISEVIIQIEDIKGELVIVVEPNLQKKTYDNLTLIEHIHFYIKEGYTPNDAIKQVAHDRGLPKNAVYKEYHKGDTK